MELGELALGARLARLAERLFDEVQGAYRAQNIDFDPRDFLLLRALLRSEHSSVCALSREIHCTHARASQKLSDFERRKLVERVASEDARQSRFRLSAKGRQLVERLQPTWRAIQKTLAQDFHSDLLLGEISKFEKKMVPGSLSSKILADVSSSIRPQEGSTFEQLGFKVFEPPFSSQVCAEFERLNRDWLEEASFVVETEDKKLFADLSHFVERHRGALLIAERNGRMVGTALVFPRSQETYEIARFCVEKAQRSRGIGRRLLAFCEMEAALRGAKEMYLVTSTKLEAARRLYERAGYQVRSLEECSLARANLAMSKRL